MINIAVDKESIIVTINTEGLKTYLEYGELDTKLGGVLSITNLDVFSESLAKALREEYEDGSSLITEVIDTAVIKMSEYTEFRGAEIETATDAFLEEDE